MASSLRNVEGCAVVTILSLQKFIANSGFGVEDGVAASYCALTRSSVQWRAATSVSNHKTGTSGAPERVDMSVVTVERRHMQRGTAVAILAVNCISSAAIKQGGENRRAKVVKQASGVVKRGHPVVVLLRVLGTVVNEEGDGVAEGGLFLSNGKRERLDGCVKNRGFACEGDLGLSGEERGDAVEGPRERGDGESGVAIIVTEIGIVQRAEHGRELGALCLRLVLHHLSRSELQELLQASGFVRFAGGVDRAACTIAPLDERSGQSGKCRERSRTEPENASHPPPPTSNLALPLPQPFFRFERFSAFSSRPGVLQSESAIFLLLPRTHEAPEAQGMGLPFRAPHSLKLRPRFHLFGCFCVQVSLVWSCDSQYALRPYEKFTSDAQQRVRN
jgi:hypothetical protein